MTSNTKTICLHTETVRHNDNILIQSTAEILLRITVGAMKTHHRERLEKHFKISQRISRKRTYFIRDLIVAVNGTAAAQHKALSTSSFIVHNHSLAKSLPSLTPSVSSSCSALDIRTLLLVVAHCNAMRPVRSFHAFGIG